MGSLFKQPSDGIFKQPGLFGSQHHEERGILGTLAYETGADFLGAVKTGAAPIGSLLKALGVPGVVPVTMEDLTTRDLKGAAMVAALGLTAPIGAAVKSTFIAKQLLSKAPVLGEIGVTAFTDAMTGAAYGMLAPLDDDGDRLREVEENAAIFGAFGLGIGVVGAGAKAVKVGLAAKKAQVDGSMMLAAATQQSQAILQVQEFAGRTLVNPETGTRALVRRQGPEKVVVDMYQPFIKGPAERWEGQEGISGPAVNYNGKILTHPGARTHLDVQKAYPKETADFRKWGKDAPKFEFHDVFGYETNRGRFVKALDAAKIAKDAGQLSKVREYNGEIIDIHSEDFKSFFPKAKAKQGYETNFGGFVNGPTATRAARDFRPGPKAMPQKSFPDMNSALAWAVERGHLQDLGPVRDKLVKSAEFLDPTLRTQIGEGSIEGVVEALHIGEYSQVQAAAALFKDAKDKLGALAAEILIPTDVVGVPSMSQKMRSDIAAAAGVTKNMTNQDLLHAAMEKGVLDVESLRAGWSINKLAREFELNGRLPKGTDIHVSRIGDAFMTSVLLPSRLAQFFPQVQPMVASAIGRFQTLSEAITPKKDWLYQLRLAIPMEHAVSGIGIIDASGPKALAQAAEIDERLLLSGAGPMAPTDAVALAREIAKKDAAATGNEHVIKFVNESVDLLDDYLHRHQAAGYLQEGGFPGYFPINNIGSWHVEVVKNGKVEFRGFYASEEKARRVAAEAKMEGGVESTAVAPNTLYWDDDSMIGMNPKHYARLSKAAREAGADPKEAEAIASSMAYVGPGKKTTGHFQRRILGSREFSEDPFETLDIYINTSERVLAFSDFNREATRLLETISPVAQPRLRAWGEQFRDDIMGKPRASEVAFQNFMTSMARYFGKDEVQPRALARYTSVLRNWETFSRLGGVFSGVVNLTQIGMNTYPVLGARWTGEGIKALWGDEKLALIERMHKAGYKDLTMHVPFASAGQVTSLKAESEKIGAAFKESHLYGWDDPKKYGKYKDEIQRIAMFAFNGAEKTNRFVTAAGAFKKALHDGMDEVAAATYAKQIVERTQFNYSLANLPEALRGPLGAFLFQFKTFVLNEVNFIASLDKGEMKRFAMALWGLGGAGLMMNSPPGEVIDAATGVFSDGKMSEWLKVKTGDNEWARGAVYGIPGLMGVDATDYMGVGNLSDISRAFSGPAVTDIFNVTKFLGSAAVDLASSNGVEIKDETKNNFIQKSMPAWIRRGMRASDLLDTGEVRNPYDGKLIYKPENRYVEATKEFIGFPSIQMTQERTADQITTVARQRYVKAHAAFGKEAAQALRDGDNDMYETVLRRSDTAGHPLDAKTIAYWYKELNKTGAERRMSRTPKALRDDLSELYDVSGSVDPRELDKIF